MIPKENNIGNVILYILIDFWIFVLNFYCICKWFQYYDFLWPPGLMTMFYVRKWKIFQVNNSTWDSEVDNK